MAIQKLKVVVTNERPPIDRTRTFLARQGVAVDRDTIFSGRFPNRIADIISLKCVDILDEDPRVYICEKVER